MATQKKGGGSRKIGRNKKWCEMYRTRGQRERNKEKKQARHRKRMQRQAEKVAARERPQT